MTLLQVKLAIRQRGQWSSTQGWFLNWLGNPMLAARLHDQPGRKPYTLSQFAMGETFRLTTLNAELTEAVLERLRVPDQEVSVTQQEQSSYEALVRDATEQPSELGLRFITPTSFHSGGLDVPLPLPSLVFGSLIHAWDTLSQLPLPIHLGNFVRDHVALMRHQIRTERVIIPGHGAHTGFTGYARFGVVKANKSAETETIGILLGALVAYAAFAGVGIRTTAGMGQAVTGRNRPDDP